MRWPVLVLAALLVLLQYPLWLGKGGWLRVWEVDRQLHSQRAENLRLEQRNASLDAEGEAALLQAIGRARDAGCTIVMISHRPSALAGADRLAVLADGRLQHFGAREEVLARLQPPAAPRPFASLRRVGV